MPSLVEIQNNYTTAATTMVNSTVIQEETTYDYMRDQNKIFTEADAIAVTTLLACLSAFGMVANGLTFIVILRLPKSIFNVILASLCVSDFLSAIDSPFVIYRSTYGYRYYEISEAVCKLAQAVDFWTTAITIQHILLFSILRFISIKNPHKFRRVTPKHAVRAIVAIWVETLLVGFVCFMLWPGVAQPPQNAFGGRSCRMQKRWVPMAKIYSMYVFPILLYLPMALVIIISASLCILIAKRKYDKKNEKFKITTARNSKTAKKENFALVQLTLIIASFLLGYIPDIAYRATAIIAKSRGRPLIPRTEWLFSVIAHCFLRVSECLNPVFYNLGSSKMREATFAFLRGCKDAATHSRSPTSTKSSENGVSTPNAGNSTPRTATTRF